MAAATTTPMSAAFLEGDFIIGTPKAWGTMINPALENTVSLEEAAALKLDAESLAWKRVSQDGTLKEKAFAEASQSIARGVATSPFPDRATAHGSGESRLDPRSVKWCRTMISCRFEATPTNNKSELFDRDEMISATSSVGSQRDDRSLSSLLEAVCRWCCSKNEVHEFSKRCVVENAIVSLGRDNKQNLR
jgi:hypothetical protein